MSTYPTPLTKELYGYLLDFTIDSDDLLELITKDAVEKGFPAIYISSEQAAFLLFLIKLLDAKLVVEIGTLFGYSAISMAKALPDGGRLISVEKDPKAASLAAANALKTGLHCKIDVVNMDGSEYLRGFKPDKPIDLVFLDADKQHYSEYLSLAAPLIRRGGVIAADNAFAFGEIVSANPTHSPETIKAIHEFNIKLKSDSRFYTCLLPVGDGLIMGVKI